MPQPSGYDPEETAEIGTDAGYVYVLINPVMPDLIKIGIARDVAALNREQRRAERFNFGMVDIRPGAVLTWVRDPSITCTVYNDRQVVFEGNVVSLSDAAKTLAARAGSKKVAFRGPLYWKYQGKTLQEWRTEREDAE